MLGIPVRSIGVKVAHSVVPKAFVVDGVKHKYCLNTKEQANTERIVELGYSYDFYNANKHDDFLEVGNVMCYYFNMPTTRDVIDKYEKAPGVINEDIVTFAPKKKYDLIIAISTMEHVGFDAPEEKDPGKSLAGMQRMMQMLKPGGKMLITVPIGYNPSIDAMIRENKVQFTKRSFVKRNSYANFWVQTDEADALKRTYAIKYNAANAIALLEYDA